MDKLKSICILSLFLFAVPFVIGDWCWVGGSCSSAEEANGCNSSACSDLSDFSNVAVSSGLKYYNTSDTVKNPDGGASVNVEAVHDLVADKDNLDKIVLTEATSGNGGSGGIDHVLKISGSVNHESLTIEPRSDEDGNFFSNGDVIIHPDSSWEFKENLVWSDSSDGFTFITSSGGDTFFKPEADGRELWGSTNVVVDHSGGGDEHMYLAVLGGNHNINVGKSIGGTGSAMLKEDNKIVVQDDHVFTLFNGVLQDINAKGTYTFDVSGGKGRAYVNSLDPESNVQIFNGQDSKLFVSTSGDDDVGSNSLVAFCNFEASDICNSWLDPHAGELVGGNVPIEVIDSSGYYTFTQDTVNFENGKILGVEEEDIPDCSDKFCTDKGVVTDTETSFPSVAQCGVSFVDGKPETICACVCWDDESEHYSCMDNVAGTLPDSCSASEWCYNYAERRSVACQQSGEGYDCCCDRTEVMNDEGNCVEEGQETPSDCNSETVGEKVCTHDGWVVGPAGGKECINNGGTYEWDTFSCEGQCCKDGGCVDCEDPGDPSDPSDPSDPEDPNDPSDPSDPDEPSCSDGIKNQGEDDVDCGGPCDPCCSFSFDKNAQTIRCGFDEYTISLSHCSGSVWYTKYVDGEEKYNEYLMSASGNSLTATPECSDIVGSDIEGYLCYDRDFGDQPTDFDTNGNGKCDEGDDTFLAKYNVDIVRPECTPDNASIECNDSNSCTRELCEEGACVNEELTGPSCECEGGNCECKAGECIKNCTENSECNDTNPCTNDECVDGLCENRGITGTECDSCDEDYCICEDGNCTIGCNSNDDCDDSKFCTNDICTDLNNCENNNKDGATCSDCDTSNCFCIGGLCEPGCSSHSECTNGFCNVSDGKCYTCVEDSNCDDSNDCTLDECSGHQCTNTEKDDGASCTESGSNGYCLDGTCRSNCDSDSQCFGDFPACHPEDKLCVECAGNNADTYCPTKECKELQGCFGNECVYEPVANGTDCSCAAGACGCFNGECVAECYGDDSCNDPNKPICSDEGFCVECVTESDCDAGECKTATCNQGTCVFENAVNGSLCDDGEGHCCSGYCDKSVGNDDFNESCRSGPVCDGSSWEYVASNNSMVCDGECKVCIDGMCSYNNDSLCTEPAMCYDGSCSQDCTDECSAGEKTCVGSGKYKECVQHGDCYVWSTVSSCPTGGTCTNAICSDGNCFIENIANGNTDGSACYSDKGCTGEECYCDGSGNCVARKTSTEASYAVPKKDDDKEDAPKTDAICNQDGICGSGENYVNCKADCDSGEKDGVCDDVSDGKCDPDCDGTDEDCETGSLWWLWLLILLLLIAGAGLYFYDQKYMHGALLNKAKTKYNELKNKITGNKQKTVQEQPQKSARMNKPTNAVRANQELYNYIEYMKRHGPDKNFEADLMKKGITQNQLAYAHNVVKNELNRHSKRDQVMDKFK